MMEEERGRMLGMQYLQHYLIGLLVEKDQNTHPVDISARLLNFTPYMQYTYDDRQCSSASSD